MPRYENKPHPSHKWKKLISCVCINNVVMSMSSMCVLIMIVFLQMSDATSVFGTHDHYSRIVDNNYHDNPIIYHQQLAYPGMYYTTNS